MAKRPVQPGDNKEDLELKKFTYDPVTKRAYINIEDQAIIDAITGINGNNNTDTTILNEALVANTEKEIDCGANVKYVLLRSRNKKRLKLAYLLGNTNSEYITLEVGTVYTDNSFYNSLKIYLLCEAADTVEVLIKRNA